MVWCLKGEGECVVCLAEGFPIVMGLYQEVCLGLFMSGGGKGRTYRHRGLLLLLCHACHPVPNGVAVRLKVRFRMGLGCPPKNKPRQQ